MKTFIPAFDFLGYPDNKTATHFKRGKEATVSEAYYKLLVEKGLVDEDGTPKRKAGALNAPDEETADKLAKKTRTGKARQSKDD